MTIYRKGRWHEVTSVSGPWHTILFARLEGK